MDLEKKAMLEPKNVRELALSTLYYISGSIFGPLVLFLGLGYFLDKMLQTKPIMLVVGFFLAFVTSNVLLFKKLTKINKLMDSHKAPLDKKDGEAEKDDNA